MQRIPEVYRLRTHWLKHYHQTRGLYFYELLDLMMPGMNEEDASGSVATICNHLNQGAPGYCKKTIEVYNIEAKWGFPDAQFHLGECFAKGDGFQQDYETAVEWYTKAAEQGHMLAQCTLAAMNMYGIGVDKNHETALEWYKKAAEHDQEPFPSFKLGDCYSVGIGAPQSNELAVEWYMHAIFRYFFMRDSVVKHYPKSIGISLMYKKAIGYIFRYAEQGMASAQYDLAEMYELGILPNSLEDAVKWYKKAAKQNYAYSILKLGNFYSRGEGLQKNDKKAFELYTKAAKLGNLAAMIQLVDHYAYTIKTPEDLDKAMKLCVSILNHNKLSKDSLYETLSILNVLGDDCMEKRNYEKAVECYTLASRHGWPWAQCSLGDCYAEGIGVAKNEAKAVELYLEAAQHDDAPDDLINIGAHRRLGDCYALGKGVPRDNEKAVWWYTIAAENGDVYAQCRLGDCYSEGKGVLRDDEEAAKWYLEAAEQEDSYAQCRMGDCYLEGKGVPQSDEEATMWYFKALGIEEDEE